MSSISRDDQNQSSDNLVIDDKLYKMAESQLKVFIAKEREEILSDTRSHRRRTLSSIDPPSFSERLKNTLGQWSFVSGSAAGVAATIAVVLVLPRISPAPSTPDRFEDSSRQESPIAELTRSATGKNEEIASSDILRVVDLVVDKPLESALSDAKKLLADGVGISGITNDEKAEVVSMLVPVTTESEVYFLETYKTEIGQDGFSLRPEKKLARVLYRKNKKPA